MLNCAFPVFPTDPSGVSCFLFSTYMLTFSENVGLVHTVVSISACGAEHPGSIPGLDKPFYSNALSTSVHE